MLFVRAAHVPGVRAATSLLSGHRWEMGSGEDGTAPPRSSCGPPALLQTHPRWPRPTAQPLNAAWSCPGCGFEGVIAVIAHPVKLLHIPCSYCTPHALIAHPMKLLHTACTYYTPQALIAHPVAPCACATSGCSSGMGQSLARMQGTAISLLPLYTTVQMIWFLGEAGEILAFPLVARFILVIGR